MKRVKKRGGLFRRGEEDLSRCWNMNHSDGSACKDEQVYFTSNIAKKFKVEVDKIKAFF